MEKIKSFSESEKGKDILIVMIVILVGLGSFELGRLSKESGSGGIKIEYPSQNSEVQNANQEANAVSSVAPIANSNPSGKTFFASSRGSKYYTTSCAAGKTIKQENRIYFSTGEEAVAAGYTLSSSCN